MALERPMLWVTAEDNTMQTIRHPAPRRITREETPHTLESTSAGAVGEIERDPSDPRMVLIGGRRFRLVPVEDPADIGLSARQVEIIRMVASGLVNKQIADVLAISEWTVSTHLRRIFARLGVDTRAAMVSRFMTMTA